MIRNKKFSLVFASVVLSQKRGKVDFHSTGKVWQNTNISNLWVSQIFRLNYKSRQFPKRAESGFPWYGKSVGKHKHFKFMGFLNISGEAEIHTVPKTWGKLISIVREKYLKTQTFQSYVFLKYFG